MATAVADSDPQGHAESQYSCTHAGEAEGLMSQDGLSSLTEQHLPPAWLSPASSCESEQSAL